MRAKRYEELEVYQCALDLQRKIFQETRYWPKEERYSLIDQIRRSSRSIGANIAEAWGKRRYPAHFTSKITDADAEQLETRHWLSCAKDCQYLQEKTFSLLLQHCEHVGRMIGKILQSPERWTGGR